MDIFRVILSRIIYGGGVLFDLAKWLIVLLVLFLMVNTFFAAIFIVDGASMEPNLHDKELILWQKNSYQKSAPQRGDIVVINYPGDPNHKKYVKRIVGLPGDMIQVKSGSVLVNGEKLPEPYLPFGTYTDQEGTWLVGKNQYFVMGDNRPNSNDSRYFGQVDRRFVLGKSLAIIFPRFRLTKDI